MRGERPSRLSFSCSYSFSFLTIRSFRRSSHALYSACATVRLRLKLEGVAVFAAIEQAGEQIGATTCMFWLNLAAFQQCDDFGMFLQGLNCRLRVFDDNPVFTRDYFEWRGFAFLMESAARFAVHDALRSDNECVRLLEDFLDSCAVFLVAAVEPVIIHDHNGVIEIILDVFE